DQADARMAKVQALIGGRPSRTEALDRFRRRRAEWLVEARRVHSLLAEGTDDGRGRARELALVRSGPLFDAMRAELDGLTGILDRDVAEVQAAAAVTMRSAHLQAVLFAIVGLVVSGLVIIWTVRSVTSRIR